MVRLSQWHMTAGGTICYSVTPSCVTLCDPMDCSTPGFPVRHQLLELNQTHVHWVGDAIQPSHPLPSPSPPAPNLSQHQGLLQWVRSSHQLAKVMGASAITPCNEYSGSTSFRLRTIALTRWTFVCREVSLLFNSAFLPNHKHLSDDFSWQCSGLNNAQWKLVHEGVNIFTPTFVFSCRMSELLVVKIRECLILWKLCVFPLLTLTSCCFFANTGDFVLLETHTDGSVIHAKFISIPRWLAWMETVLSVAGIWASMKTKGFKQCFQPACLYIVIRFW